VRDGTRGDLARFTPWLSGADRCRAPCGPSNPRHPPAPWL